MFPALTGSPVIAPRWSKLTGGDALAVDLAKVKNFVNRALEDDTWDDELTRFVKTAQLAVEKHIEASLTPATWRGTLPQFWDQFRIVRRPFVEVTSIEYVQPDGEIVTLDTDLYQSGPIEQMLGMVYRAENPQWPSTARRFDAVRINVRSGYCQDEDDVALGHEMLPEDIEHALLMTIASLDNARGDTASSSDATVFAMKAQKKAGAIPQEARTILAPYKYVVVTL